MKKFICKVNFVSGPKGSYVHNKKGDAFQIMSAEGERIVSDEEIQDLLDQGMIMDRDSITVEELAELEKKIEAAKAELSALQAKLKELKKKPQEKEPEGGEEEPNGESDIDEELLDEVDDALEGEEEESEEEESEDRPKAPAGLKGKALKAWKKKNWK